MTYPLVMTRSTFGRPGACARGQHPETFDVAADLGLRDPAARTAWERVLPPAAVVDVEEERCCGARRLGWAHRFVDCPCGDKLGQSGVGPVGGPTPD